MVGLLPLFVAFAALRAEGPWGVAFPPDDVTTPRPALVFLHGMWASPEDSCAYFARGATPFGFLVCPRGNAPLGDGTMWAGTAIDAERAIRRAFDGTEKGLPGHLTRQHGGTLMGYSNGAYFAAEVAYQEPGRWSGLVLLSMKLDLEVTRLRAAGIERIVLGAADHDSAKKSLRDAAERLSASGFPTQFVSLGPGGHELPRDISARMCGAIAWVRGAPRPACADGSEGAREGEESISPRP